VTDALLAADVPIARPSKRLEDAEGNAISLSPEEQTLLAMARGQTRRAGLERAVSRAQGKPIDRQREIFEKAKSQGISDITRRARRAKKKGEKLSEEVVSKKRIDSLYESYLASR
jgi:hypothetical protein